LIREPLTCQRRPCEGVCDDGIVEKGGTANQLLSILNGYTSLLLLPDLVLLQTVSLAPGATRADSSMIAARTHLVNDLAIVSACCVVVYIYGWCHGDDRIMVYRVEMQNSWASIHN
jgi:hypothetical protein